MTHSTLSWTETIHFSKADGKYRVLAFYLLCLSSKMHVYTTNTNPHPQLSQHCPHPTQWRDECLQGQKTGGTWLHGCQFSWRENFDVLIATKYLLLLPCLLVQGIHPCCSRGSEFRQQHRMQLSCSNLQDTESQNASVSAFANSASLPKNKWVFFSFSSDAMLASSIPLQAYPNWPLVLGHSVQQDPSFHSPQLNNLIKRKLFSRMSTSFFRLLVPPKSWGYDLFGKFAQRHDTVLWKDTQMSLSDAPVSKIASLSCCCVSNTERQLTGLECPLNRWTLWFVWKILKKWDQ